MTKVALVTGASKGIGRGCAAALAESGYKVAIHYRSGEQDAHELAGILPESKAFQADLSEPDQLAELVKKVKADLGPIGVLVNNAGMSIDQLITFAKPDDFSRLIDVNLKPVFGLTKAVSKMMIKQKSGSIINITSVIGHTGNAGQSMYAATKGAITAFTKSIALDLAGFGIRANCIAPGFIETAMTDALPEEVKEATLERIPLKRFGSTNDIGNAVAFLASEQAAYITGSTLHVNGGMFTN